MWVWQFSFRRCVCLFFRMMKTEDFIVDICITCTKCLSPDLLINQIVVRCRQSLLLTYLHCLWNWASCWWPHFLAWRIRNQLGIRLYGVMVGVCQIANICHQLVMNGEKPEIPNDYHTCFVHVVYFLIAVIWNVFRWNFKEFQCIVRIYFEVNDGVIWTKTLRILLDRWLSKLVECDLLLCRRDW